MGDGSIGFIVIDPVYLSEAASDEPGLVFINFTCSVLLDFDNPFAVDNIGSFRWVRHNVPGMCVSKTLEFGRSPLPIVANQPAFELQRRSWVRALRCRKSQCA
jgi:hypothetical protein